ncbi:MAG: D-tyrosyl-tRNA(Tyr) deacylase [Bacteroidales bacterium]|nr:D-tyrosyl-tRNA(Tyr) deacylase [Bacteroidales bacterium]MBQ2917920.1 D-tyrosyl-tRNA(Tyr) deacylase [Bacteroidales bacterium]MBQ3251584.1 D-tyrosyl-tRNA(Tyr) deacylase [Bacteroidales bacterium]
MRLVIQRVTQASVAVPAEGYESAIGKGLMVLAAFIDEDTQEDLDWCARKLAAMRIFDDEEGVMNLSVRDVDGEVLIVSQFTLYASTVKGNRPSYIKAAKPDVAIPLYEKFLTMVEEQVGKPVGRGIFGADMKVSLVNDGPVTIIVDSKLKF